MTLKYLLTGCLVALAVFAFSRRDYVLDSFDTDQAVEQVSVAGFDPVARADELRRPPPPLATFELLNASDTGDVELAPIDEPAPDPVEIEGGSARISGVVIGPGGRVPEATVRIERFIGRRFGAIDITANDDGFFSAAGVLGGRYRVRAWRQPSHYQPGSEVLFVDEGENVELSLDLSVASGSDVATEVSSGGWQIGESPTISVRVRGAIVSEEGKVGLGARSGVTVSVDVGGALAGSGTATTDGSGWARFALRCDAVGPATATARVGGLTRNLGVPACSPPPTTTTTTTVPTEPTEDGEGGEGDGGEGASTSSTTPGQSGSTTTAASRPTTTAGGGAQGNGPGGGN